MQRKPALPLRPYLALRRALQEFKEQHGDKPFRRKVFLLLTHQAEPDSLQLIIEKLLMLLIALSVCSVILESVEGLYAGREALFNGLETLFIVIFTAEYLMRLYTAPEDPRFGRGLKGLAKSMTNPSQVTDLLAILPFWISLFTPSHLDLRFLRIVRLVRVLKLVRYNKSSRTLLKVLQNEWPVIAASIFIMVIFVVLLASLGYLFEHKAQPDKFQNIPQAIYWAVITLASVGYGDISPITEGGRLATVAASLAGIGIFALPAAILSSAFVDQMHRDRETLRDEIANALEDGHLSEASRHRIAKIAEDLSLSDDEIQTVLRREIARQAREERQELAREAREAQTILAGGGMGTGGQANSPVGLVGPGSAWPSEPGQALEHYRQLVSLLRQARLDSGLSTRLEGLIQDPNQVTDRERAVWRALD